MFLYAARESDLLALLGADGAGELDLGKIALDSGDAAASAGGADVDHERLALADLLDTGLLLVGLDAEELLEEEEVDLDLDEDVGQSADRAQHLSHQTIGTTKGGVDVGAHTCQA